MHFLSMIQICSRGNVEDLALIFFKRNFYTAVPVKNKFKQKLKIDEKLRLDYESAK